MHRSLGTIKTVFARRDLKKLKKIASRYRIMLETETRSVSLFSSVIFFRVTGPYLEVIGFCNHVADDLLARKDG